MVISMVKPRGIGVCLPHPHPKPSWELEQRPRFSCPLPALFRTPHPALQAFFMQQIFIECLPTCSKWDTGLDPEVT